MGRKTPLFANYGIVLQAEPEKLLDLTAVRRPEQSESLQGVAKFRRNFELRGSTFGWVNNLGALFL